MSVLERPGLIRDSAVEGASLLVTGVIGSRNESGQTWQHSPIRICVCVCGSQLSRVLEMIHRTQLP